jgi:hypothetical protein
MFCQFCGSPIDASATVCPKCGKAQTRAGARAASGSNVGDQIGSSAKDAVTALTSLVVNPVGGLAPSYTSLGPTRALGAGIALCIFFALIVALGLVVGDGSVVLSFLFMAVGYGAESNFGLFMRAFIALLVLPAAMIGVSYGIRKVLQGDGPVAADAFTVGSALTPFGIGAFLGNLLGSANAELGGLLMLFGMTYAVLILYAGFTRLGGLTEKAAAPAVPIAFVVSLYICKVVFGAISS